MNTIQNEDRDLALLIERHLDGDPEATRALDARLAADPEAARAFAHAHRMEALLADHLQSPSLVSSHAAGFLRPLVWLAAAASIALLAWFAFRPKQEDPPAVAEEATFNANPDQRGGKRLIPEGANEPPEEPGIAGLSASALERKAWNFYLPAVEARNVPPDEALDDLRDAFRTIASRHGDAAASGVQFEFIDSTETPATIRFELKDVPLISALSGIALQSGAELQITDGRVSIIRNPVPKNDDSPYRSSLKISSVAALMLGYVPPPPSDDDTPDDPFAARVLDAPIPEVSFLNATISEVIDELTSRSRELDPENRGLNFVVKIPRNAAAQQTRFTMSGRNLPISAVLRALVDESGLKFVEEAHAVVIALESDFSVGQRPFSFEFSGFSGQYDSVSGRVVLQGNKTLVERTEATLRALDRGPKGDDSNSGLIVSNPYGQQVLIKGTFLGYRPENFAATGGSDELAAELPLAEGIVKAGRDPDDLIKELAKSSDSRILASPSVITRANQRAKIEIIREIIYLTPDADGKMVFEMAPAGWTLESDPTLIGEAVHLRGMLSFGGLSDSPDFDSMMSPSPASPAPEQGEEAPVGNPVRVQELEFEIELLPGQAALLEFARLEDGHRVVAVIQADRISPSGHKIFP